ncbi:armadillo-type protein [Sporodiniella umbellata]|nr:armadillo-type protein [Sporodiniella umbellata]
MPSFIQPPLSNRPVNSSSAALLLSTIEAGRHRSGSLNLPPVDASYWTLNHDGPLSPSSEQLLQNDNDFSIARTMRSLGLEDETENKRGKEEKDFPNSLFHHKSPPEFHLPSRSLLSGNSRNRSYSVNSAARYDIENNGDILPSGNLVVGGTYSKNTAFASPLEGFNRQQNRPRAVSMGRADSSRANPILLPQASFWGNNNNGQRPSPLVSMTEEEYEDQSGLSLGDSELLANILNKNSNSTDSNPLHESANQDISTIERPFLSFSQSTPTFKENYPTQNANQQHSRSLWVGNVDNTVTIEMLTQVFSMFGPIESVRLLLEKECAFINFFNIEDAIRAKEDVLTHMGGRIGNSVVRIGYGKADAVVTETNVSQPTRALWLGNIPVNTTPSLLQSIFGGFGAIESIRILSHKSCSFINFESADDAVAARDALLQNKIFAPGFSAARVGFAKIPSVPALSTKTSDSNLSAPVSENMDFSVNTAKQATSNKVVGQDDAAIELWQKDLYHCMEQLGIGEHVTLSSIEHLKVTSLYHDSIPPVPELTLSRKFDSARLKEIRKRLDNAEDGAQEAEMIAFECMSEIAEITSDYIGNTLVQRLFEKCSEETKTQMLEIISPHLAANSVHKNGTWAAQKIIDLAKTPTQIEMVRQSLQPYLPPLLLDQFGNYAVQCYLRLGEVADSSFIFDAMVEKVMTIAQGRFGARSMRGILEGEYVNQEQKVYIAASLCQNSVALSTNANGTLLLSWLIESPNIENRMQVLASQLAPSMVQLCTHKISSQTVYKLLNQESDPVAQDIIFKSLSEEKTLSEILTDQLRGLSFVQKVLTCPSLNKDQASSLCTQVCLALEKLKGPGHKKLLDQLVAETSQQPDK